MLRLKIILFLLPAVLFFSGCGRPAAVAPTAPVPGLEPEPVPSETVNTVPAESEETEKQPVAEITTPDETKVAQKVLVDFFDLLRRNKFEEAAELVDLKEEDWQNFAVYSAEGEWDDKAKVLENHCLAAATCLSIRVLSSERIDNETYRFKVRFLNSDGSTFELGPCCGASEEEMPTQREFDYDVRKIDDAFMVVTPPLYRP